MSEGLREILQKISGRVIDLSAELIRVSEEVDALTIGLSVSDESVAIPLREPGRADSCVCEHRNIQKVEGAGGAQERTICVDCGKEL